uniref:Uncharacterized protein n=1 Tax=Caenorhabditis japonica TaxID=281687 RepID=A0A8R1DPU2_CAEJA
MSDGGFKKHPVDKLKETFEKLNNEVKNLGMILGVKEEAAETPKSEDKNQYHKDVTAEDKKARKAAKAAEKKARAEKSLAGKAAAAAGGTPQQHNNDKKKKKADPSESTVQLVEENKKLTETVENLANQMESLALNSAPPMNERKNSADLKSAIKKSTGVEKNVRHVHNVILPSAVTFDLPKNQVKIVAQSSESDDGITSELETAVVAQLEDASSFAHVHSAFLTLLAKSEQEKFSDVETVCIEFIIAFKKFLHDWTSDRCNSDPSTYAHDLDVAIRPQLAHLTQNGLWPLPFALGNTVRLLKRTIKRVQESSNSECEQTLQTYLDDTLAINFSHAYKAISQLLVRKIELYKKVAVFDWCPVVDHVLLNAREQMPDMQLTVIDVNSRGRGIRHVKSFTDRGYKVKYMNLKAASWAALD